MRSTSCTCCMFGCSSRSCCFGLLTSTALRCLSTSVGPLRWLVVFMVAYMVVRTWLAYVDPPRLKWWYVFPPMDVAWTTAILCVTHRGPMSNIAYLYLLPMIQASGSLNVRWSAVVGVLVIVGTAVVTLFATLPPILLCGCSANSPSTTLVEDDPLNACLPGYVPNGAIKPHDLPGIDRFRLSGASLASPPTETVSRWRCTTASKGT